MYSTRDPEVCCPQCGNKFDLGDAWEMKEGSWADCPKCEAKLECTDTDIIRYWHWAAREVTRG